MRSHGKRRRLQSRYGYPGSGNVDALLMQIALIGWQPGAFRLIACDGCMDWSAEQRLRRLHLIANSSRFVILTPRRAPNLVSRVPGSRGEASVRGPGRMN